MNIVYNTALILKWEKMVNGNSKYSHKQDCRPHAEQQAAELIWINWLGRPLPVWAQLRAATLLDLEVSLASGNDCCQRKLFYSQDGIAKFSHTELNIVAEVKYDLRAVLRRQKQRYKAQWHKCLTAKTSLYNLRFEHALYTFHSHLKQMSHF